MKESMMLYGVYRHGVNVQRYGGYFLDSVGISVFHSEPIITQRINMDNSNEEIMTRLELGLVSSSQCTQRGLDDDSGGGANAGSGTNMMFVTINPLSELVWSPHKGLSLKSADCSLTEKNPSLLLGMGSRNMLLSPPEGITVRGTNCDGPGVGGNLISSQMASHFESEVSDTVTLARPLRSTITTVPVCGPAGHVHNSGLGGNTEGLNTRMEVSILDLNKKSDDHTDKKERDLCYLNDIQTTTSWTRGNTVSNFQGKTCMPGPENGGPVDCSSKMKQPTPDLSQVELVGCGDLNAGKSLKPDRGNSNIPDMEVLTSELPTIRHNTHNAPMQIIRSPDSKQGGLAPVIDENRKNNDTLEKHELTAKNDLCLESETACAEVDVTVISKPADEGKDSLQQNGGTLPKDLADPVESSPNNSISSLYQRKGKGKALSGEVNGKNRKEEDDSHASVKICNSVGSFSAGKRPWSLEQPIVSNKKVKKQSDKSPDSASFTRKNSSFMNWMSNMVKGLSKSDPDETPSLSYTVRTPHHENVSHDQHFIPCEKNQDPGCRSLGFQTIFQSLYLPNNRLQDMRTWNLDHQRVEGSEELDLANLICDNNSSTRPQIPMSNEKFNHITSGNTEGPSTLAIISSAHIALPANHKTNDTEENNNSCNFACGPEKGGVGSFNSSFRNDYNSPCEEKAAYGFIDLKKSSTSVTNRSSPLCSAWITRFSPKVFGPQLNSPQCRQNIDDAIDGSTDCMRPPTHFQNCLISSKGHKKLEDARKPSAEDQMDVISGKLQNCAANATASLGLKGGHTDQKLTFKLNPILPSQRFKSSEDMTSVLVRRLNALRNIIPPEVADNTTRATITCFFCGIRGHNLRDCSEILESELDDLPKNIRSHDGAEESTCLCLRCFELNHWPIACPSVSLREESHSDGNASLVIFRSCGKLQHNSNDERNLKPIENKVSQCQVAVAVKVSDGERSRVNTELLVRMSTNKSGKMIVNEWASDSKKVKNDSLGNIFYEGMKGQRASREFVLNKKQTASCSAENELKENEMITPIGNFVPMRIPDVPGGTFEAIRRLRLSRTNILKWMTSPISVSCLEGFFIRLRLGKWENGLGETGYHVARINGALRERSSGSSKIPLSVNIGGFKCLVESRYLSNHDFNEDELMAWWVAASRGGGKLPSEEDLKMKLEERKKLGF